jgi:GNAT superfamily N-acetyltransferase
MVDVALRDMSGRFEAIYGEDSRKSIPPERLLTWTPYIAVHDQHRGNGLSHRLVHELLNDRVGALYATTDDEYMKRTLVAAGFAQQGGEWEGNRGRLSLWIRS